MYQTHSSIERLLWKKVYHNPVHGEHVHFLHTHGLRFTCVEKFVGDFRWLQQDGAKAPGITKVLLLQALVGPIPSTVVELSTGYPFGRYFLRGELPAGLKRLDLAYEFSYSLCSSVLPEGLDELTIRTGERFYDWKSFPLVVRRLNLTMHASADLSRPLSSKIEVLDLTGSSRSVYMPDEWLPPSLRELIMPYCYGHPVGGLPEGLLRLTINGTVFEENEYPESLIELTIPTDECDHPLRIPDNTKTLRFVCDSANHGCRPSDGVIPASGIEHLYMRSRHKMPKFPESGFFPAGLKSLTFDVAEISGMITNLPDSLEEITLGGRYAHQIDIPKGTRVKYCEARSF